MYRWIFNKFLSHIQYILRLLKYWSAVCIPLADAVQNLIGNSNLNSANKQNKRRRIRREKKVDIKSAKTLLEVHRT